MKMSGSRGWLPLAWVFLGAWGVACAAAGGAAGEAAPATPVETTSATLAGARCQGNRCICRSPGSNEPESALLPEGLKRYEIRLAAEGGRASVSAGSLGVFASAGPGEACYYVDVPVGTSHELVFAARADSAQNGLAPRLRIAEYGPKGPWWYDILAVSCAGPSGRCERAGADEWAQAARRRKRGRLEPCGSTVISKLAWETSGGQSERDGGFFRDFTARFTLEVKKFVTQFAPGSTECVPK